jgi:hypothetical protein
VLRRVKPELESHHARILSQDPAVLFDNELIRPGAKPGDLVVNNTDPVFLAIISRDGEDGSRSKPAAICRKAKPNRAGEADVITSEKRRRRGENPCNLQLDYK